MAYKGLKPVLYTPPSTPRKKKWDFFLCEDAYHIKLKIFLSLTLRREKGLDVQNQSLYLIPLPWTRTPRGMLGRANSKMHKNKVPGVLMTLGES